MKLTSGDFRKKPCDLRAISKQSALLVVDMQRDFADPERLSSEAHQRVRAILRPLQRLIAASRAAGVPVIYTQEMHRPDMSDYGIELDYEPPHCLEGSGGEEVIGELAPRPDETRVAKRRYSAFYHTDLELYLRSRRIDRLIITGLFLDVCVLHTVFDAKARDFWIYVPRECATAETQARTDAVYEIIDGVLGYVGSVDEIVAALAVDHSVVRAG
jgi:nicotinamidase-related amidase